MLLIDTKKSRQTHLRDGLDYVANPQYKTEKGARLLAEQVLQLQWQATHAAHA